MEIYRNFKSFIALNLIYLRDQMRIRDILVTSYSNYKQYHS